MAAVTICSDLETPKNKVYHCFHCFPKCHDLVFWMLNFKSAFSLSSFTFIKRLFSSSSLSVIRVVSSAYLRLLVFPPAILIPAYASSSLAFLMMYSAYKLNKQGDSIQPCCAIPITHTFLEWWVLEELHPSACCMQWSLQENAHTPWLLVIPGSRGRIMHVYNPTPGLAECLLISLPLLRMFTTICVEGSNCCLFLPSGLYSTKISWVPAVWQPLVKCWWYWDWQALHALGATVRHVWHSKTNRQRQARTAMRANRMHQLGFGSIRKDFIQRVTYLIEHWRTDRILHRKEGMRLEKPSTKVPRMWLVRWMIKSCFMDLPLVLG